MHPISTERRRRLLAASLRIERRLKREKLGEEQAARRRIAKLMRGGKPWDETTV